MEGLALDSRQSVLIIDASEETREVLQTALERRGLRILAADRARRGLELARRHHPDLIVLDLEIEGAGGGAGAESPSAPFVAQFRLGPHRAGPAGQHAARNAPDRRGIRGQALPLRLAHP